MVWRRGERSAQRALSGRSGGEEQRQDAVAEPHRAGVERRAVSPDDAQAQHALGGGLALGGAGGEPDPPADAAREHEEQTVQQAGPEAAEVGAGVEAGFGQGVEHAAVGAKAAVAAGEAAALAGGGAELHGQLPLAAPGAARPPRGWFRIRRRPGTQRPVRFPLGCALRRAQESLRTGPSTPLRTGFDSPAASRRPRSAARPSTGLRGASGRTGRARVGTPRAQISSRIRRRRSWYSSALISPISQRERSLRRRSRVSELPKDSGPPGEGRGPGAGLARARLSPDRRAAPGLDGGEAGGGRGRRASRRACRAVSACCGRRGSRGRR